MRSGRTPDGLAFAVQGEGPALLLLPGYGASAVTLRAPLAILSRSFTCVTFDYRGTGDSTPWYGSLSTRSMARDAARVLEYAGVDLAHVYGLSLGGMVAQELAIERPELIDRLVLGATTAGGWQAAIADPLDLCCSLRDARARVPGTTSTLSWVAVTHGWAAATHNSADRLDRIVAPTLVIHGERDRMLPLENAKLLARGIPNAELQILRGEGHLFAFTDRGASTRGIAAWLNGLVEPAATPSRPPRRPSSPVLNQLLPSWQSARMYLKLLTS